MEKTIPPFNTYIIGDCRDYLPLFQDGQFELAITDPPYNIQKKTGLSSKRCGKGKGTLNRKKKQPFEMKDVKITFNDDWGQDFFKWVDSWFPELTRICQGIVLTPGCAELANWIIYRKPDYQIRIWHKPNAEGFNSHWEPILFYGKIKNIQLIRDVITLKIPKNQFTNTDQYPHPAYKPWDFWFYLFNKLKPESVLDPFLGTGTTIQAAEQLGIKYNGFEIKSEYESIIKKRRDIGIKAREKPQQKILNNFISPPVDTEVTKLP